MRITTNKSAKALKWVHIKSAFYSKGLFFPIVKLLTSKSALQDSVYGPTAYHIVHNNSSWSRVHSLSGQKETKFNYNSRIFGEINFKLIFQAGSWPARSNLSGPLLLSSSTSQSLQSAKQKCHKPLCL